MSARETAELLLQVGRLVQAEGYDGELSPAQWMALRFFARANPFSRTPSAFAEFQATTRGTATQAIKALEAGGYLVRQPFKVDGRSVSLRLTSKGKKALARDPFEVLVRAVDCFYEGENMLVIHPDECIDCGVCVPECPVDAIRPDTEPGLEKWLSLNAEYAKIWPNIMVKKAPPPDSKEWEGKPDKLQYFSPNPGAGD